MHVIEVKYERVPDDSPDPSYLEQEGFEDRLAEYRNGGFGYIGIRAVATVNIAGTIQTVSSPGTWGIEDDSGEEYLASVEQDEREELRAILKEMGITEGV